MLLTTQYLDEADQLADRIAVIDRGRVVAEGTADELKASVGDSSLAAAAGGRRATLDDARSARSQHVLGVRGRVSPEAGAHHRSDDRPRSRHRPAGHGCATNGIHLAEMSVQKPTLDEVFLTITGHGVGRPDDRRRAAETRTHRRSRA